jgi:hypothetical protein
VAGGGIGRIGKADRVLSPTATEPEVSAHSGDAPLRKKCGGRSPKVKGYNFENECRHAALAKGLHARRVPLSGAGEEKGDLCITSSFGKVYRCELKRRKCLPEWIVKALGDHQLMVMRGDRGQALAVLPFADLLDLLQ